MMKLYILRHGEAVEHGDPRYPEAERPLTPKGRQRTRQLGHFLRQINVSFDVILSSPLLRARQTSQIVARQLGLTRSLQCTNNLSPSGSMEQLVIELDAIHPAPGAVLLVGHEPYLSHFISLLCTDGPGLQVKLKKGALCRLEVDHLTTGRCAQLEWLLQPRLISPKRPGQQRS